MLVLFLDLNNEKYFSLSLLIFINTFQLLNKTYLITSLRFSGNSEYHFKNSLIKYWTMCPEIILYSMLINFPRVSNVI